MTRIIAGSAGGRRLATPPGAGTRPTSDRVREAVFSALEAAVGSWAGVRFLDLYAGSGAVGLEAVSRGAAHATLVEQHRRTAGVARRNVQALGLPGVEVLVARAESLVAGPPREPHDPYDIVFLDPPYDLAEDVVTSVLARLVDQGWLAPHAVVVVERSGRGPDLAWPPGLRGDRTRRYGETAVWYGRAT
ncbi:MAG: 16S rRNA (guanine(966)-N(2))-methyltransferase RsmD [Actinomycetota bacterium]|nr:16S rRNA (guanine(966)-N(2))-methyltransferase RsmD [Actinomycetota bacterium]